MKGGSPETASCSAPVSRNIALCGIRKEIPFESPLIQNHEESLYCAHERSAEPWIPADQQPIRRVIGKRIAPPLGKVPSETTRAAMDANAGHRTRAPKGLFFYENHAQMTNDRERWTVEAIVQKQRERA